MKLRFAFDLLFLFDREGGFGRRLSTSTVLEFFAVVSSPLIVALSFV